MSSSVGNNIPLLAPPEEMFGRTMRIPDAQLPEWWGLVAERKVPAGEPIASSRVGKGERGIWQRRYWEHTIRDEIDFSRHIDYVHINPHGLVTRVSDWPYSSFHRMVRHGVYPEDWAGDVSGLDGEFGERH